jgi:hypothetical protein
MNQELETKEGRISYEPEADVLTWEISRDAAIDSAREVGNVVIHVTKHNVPVLIEILNASQLKRSIGSVLDQARGENLGPNAAGA